MAEPYLDALFPCEQTRRTGSKSTYGSLLCQLAQRTRDHRCYFTDGTIQQNCLRQYINVSIMYQCTLPVEAGDPGLVRSCTSFTKSLGYDTETDTEETETDIDTDTLVVQHSLSSTLLCSALLCSALLYSALLCSICLPTPLHSCTRPQLSVYGPGNTAWHSADSRTMGKAGDT